jgi:predicted MFS family arabinose efflux permease
MNASQSLTVTPGSETVRSRVPVFLFAVSVGVIITNIFAPQILVGLMSRAFLMPESASGLIPMIPLLGYAMGLAFLVPMADLVENRGLVMKMLAAASLAAFGIVVAPSVPVLLCLLFLLGAACSVNQVLMPVAAAIAAPEERGKVLGDIMGGLMIGILLSRPMASFLAAQWGWRGFFVMSSISMALLCAILAVRLPARAPTPTSSYMGLIGSLWILFRDEPILRKRSITAAIVMAAFNFFWTTIVYVLNGKPFHLGQNGVALFALAGAGGAIVTPIFGRLGDRGASWRATTIAHIVLICGFGIAAWSGLTPGAAPLILLIGLGLGAVMLDVGVLGDQTIGRYLINRLRPEARGRVNAIFVGVFFLGGSVGSALAGFLWGHGGWGAVCAGGAALGALASVVHRSIRVDAEASFRPV